MHYHLFETHLGFAGIAWNDEGIVTRFRLPECGASHDLGKHLTDMIHKNNWPVREFAREKASLEEAFRYYVKAGASRSPKTNSAAA